MPPPQQSHGACWLLLLVFIGVQHQRSFVLLAVPLALEKQFCNIILSSVQYQVKMKGKK